MSKTLQTKMKIVELLKQRSMTIPELSKKLDLSRATVSQHIKDLQEVRAIEEIPNIYFKKHVSYKARRLDGKTILKDAKTHWNVGNLLFEERKYAEALEEFTTAAKIDPKYADAYYNKALTEEEMNKFDAAEEDLKIVFQIQPKSHDAAVLMGIIEEKRKNIQKARRWYERALEYYPYYTDAKMRLKKLENSIA